MQPAPSRGAERWRNSCLFTVEPEEAPGLGLEREGSQTPDTGLTMICPKDSRDDVAARDHLSAKHSCAHLHCNLSSTAQLQRVLPRQLRPPSCPGGIVPCRVTYRGSSSNLRSTEQPETGRVAGCRQVNRRTCP